MLKKNNLFFLITIFSFLTINFTETNDTNENKAVEIFDAEFSKKLASLRSEFLIAANSFDAIKNLMNQTLAFELKRLMTFDAVEYNLVSTLLNNYYKSSLILDLKSFLINLSAEVVAIADLAKIDLMCFNYSQLYIPLTLSMCTEKMNKINEGVLLKYDFISWSSMSNYFTEEQIAILDTIESYYLSLSKNLENYKELIGSKIIKI